MSNPVTKIKDYLAGGSRWHKGSLHNGNYTASCLLGAAYAIEQNDYKHLGDLNGVPEIAAVIREQYPDRLMHDNPNLTNISDVIGAARNSATVSRFNDHAKTTWEDVELVLTKAELSYDEQL